MDITFEYKDLLPALDLVQQTVKDKSPTAILTCLLIEATENGEIYFRGNDGIVCLESKVKGEVSESGMFAVPAKRFYAVANVLSANNAVNISKIDDSRISVRSGNSKYTLAGPPADEFPQSLRATDKTDEDKQITLSASEFTEAIDQTVFAASKESDRNLDAVCFHFKDDHIVIVATDAVIMTQVVCKPKNVDAIDERIIVLPEIAAKHSCRIFNESAELSIWQRESAVVIGDDTNILTSRLMAGQYIAYEQYFQEQNGHKKALVNRQELIGLLKRGSVLAFLKKGNMVTLIFNPESEENQQATIKMITEVKEEGNAEDVIEVESIEDELEIHLDCDIFLTMLNAMKTKQIEIQYIDFKTFLRLESVSDDESVSNHICLLPPMRKA